MAKPLWIAVWVRGPRWEPCEMDASGGGIR